MGGALAPEKSDGASQVGFYIGNIICDDDWRTRRWVQPWVKSFYILNEFLAHGVPAAGVILIAQGVYKIVVFFEGINNNNDVIILGVKLEPAYIVFVGDFAVVGGVVAILAVKLLKRLMEDEE